MTYQPFTYTGNHRYPHKRKQGFEIGGHVWHKVHGHGEIIEEWGQWRSCSACYRTLYQSASCAKHPTTPSFGVSGFGTYDVLFADGKTRSINKAWLTLLSPHLLKT